MTPDFDPQARAREWLKEHGSADGYWSIDDDDTIASLAALLEAAMAAERAALLGLLEDCWFQWSYIVSGFDDSLDSPRFDGRLSTLEDLCGLLTKAGRLRKYALRPEMDWWVRVESQADAIRERGMKEKPQ